MLIDKNKIFNLISQRVQKLSNREICTGTHIRHPTPTLNRVPANTVSLHLHVVRRRPGRKKQEMINKYCIRITSILATNKNIKLSTRYADCGQLPDYQSGSGLRPPVIQHYIYLYYKLNDRKSPLF